MCFWLWVFVTTSGLPNKSERKRQAEGNMWVTYRECHSQSFSLKHKADKIVPVTLSVKYALTMNTISFMY